MDESCKLLPVRSLHLIKPRLLATQVGKSMKRQLTTISFDGMGIRNPIQNLGCFGEKSQRALQSRVNNMPSLSCVCHWSIGLPDGDPRDG